MKSYATKSLAIIAIVAFVMFIAYSSSTISNYSHNHPILTKVRENFAKINPDYSKIPLREGDSAFTENKEVITLCLKDPDTGKYYDMNTIMYVALHELAHVLCETQGHGDEFKKKFSKVLRYAAKLKIYDPRQQMSSTYCGLNQGESS